MDFRKKTIRSYTVRIVSILVVSALIILVALKIRPAADEQQEHFNIKYDLTLWYYDESLSSYLKDLGDEYFKSTGLRVNAVLMPSLEFFDNINKLNIEGENPPDLYMIDSTKLENAYLSSLAKPVDDTGFITSDHTKKSLEACTYKDRLVAYPFSFNVAFFAYNTELESAPEYFSDILDEYYPDEETEDPEEYDAVKEYLEAHPDETAETRMPAEPTENILGFDVSNLLYNSFFIGEYVNLGGEYGDDSTAFDLSDEKYSECLAFEQQMSELLQIDKNLSDYNRIERDFIEGKTKMAIFDTSSLIKLYGSGVDFDIARIPDLTPELRSSAMSQTSVICVNPGSKAVEEAERLAEYISSTDAEKLFNEYNLMSAKDQKYENTDLEKIKNIYEESFSLPKLIETENIWENLNNMITSVWSGEDIERAQSKLNVAIYIALSTRTEQEDK